MGHMVIRWMESFNTMRVRCFKIINLVILKKKVRRIINNTNRMMMRKIMRVVLLSPRETKKWEGRFLSNHWRMRTLNSYLRTQGYGRYTTIEIGGSMTTLITTWSLLIQALTLLNLGTKFTIAMENALIVISWLSNYYILELKYSYGFSLGANDNPYDSVEIRLVPPQ